MIYEIRRASAMVKITDSDRGILSLLRENGRMTFVDIAKEMGVSERTVRSHIRRMEEEGTIRKYTIREGGIGLTALVRIRIGPGTEVGALAGEISGWENIEIVYEVSGQADLVALVHVDDTMALRDLLDKIWMASPAEVLSTTTELVLEQY